jgi:hypothetical protein
MTNKFQISQIFSQLRKDSKTSYQSTSQFTKSFNWKVSESSQTGTFSPKARLNHLTAKS